MTKKEIDLYVKELIQKYDYYDPVKDRMEALKFAKVKGIKLLDIGAGKGLLAILAAKRFNCAVTTIDLSDKKMDAARDNAKKEKVENKVTFRVADAAKMPFPKDSFDVAMSFNALHHNRDRFRTIIDEMFRVSKNKVVITELNSNGARIFDEYVHPEENHRKMALDLKELCDYLKRLSNVGIMERKLMTTYVCEKKQREKKQQKRGGNKK